MLGNIPFEYGDYLIIPRGIIYQIQFDTEDRLFYVESFAPFYTPKRYESGQHLETLSFCERDFILPSELRPMKKGF
jgi:homogentisate 1,2-dioxygenase